MSSRKIIPENKNSLHWFLKFSFIIFDFLYVHITGIIVLIWSSVTQLSVFYLCILFALYFLIWTYLIRYVLISYKFQENR